MLSCSSATGFEYNDQMSEVVADHWQSVMKCGIFSLRLCLFPVHRAQSVVQTKLTRSSNTGPSTRHGLANLGNRDTSSGPFGKSHFSPIFCQGWSSCLFRCFALTGCHASHGTWAVVEPLKIFSTAVSFPENKHARRMTKIGGANISPVGAVGRGA